MQELSAVDDMRSRIQAKLAARQKGIPPSGKGSQRVGVYPQRSAAFHESPREAKLMQSPPPGPLFSTKDREESTSGRRYLIPTTSASYEVSQGSGSPELLRQNEELKSELHAHKLKLQQAEFQLKKQKKWLMELNEIKDNIKIFRSSGQAQSRDTSMEMRSPVEFAGRQRKDKLMSFSEYEEGQEDDEEEEAGEEDDQQQWKELEQELATVRRLFKQQHKEEADKLRGELQLEREKCVQLEGELSETIGAKERYLRDLLDLRKEIEKVKEKEREIVLEKGGLEQQIASLKNNLDTTEKELREQRTERSYSQADYQRRISEMEESYERKIQDLRRQYDEELLEVKLRAGTGLSRFILKPGDSKSSDGGTPLSRQNIQMKDECLKLKEYCSELQKVNTLLNNENRTAIAMLTRICSPAQLENLSQAINLVINSNSGTPVSNVASRSMRGSSGVSRMASSSNLYEPVNTTMPSILYESYQFTSVAPRVSSRNQTFRRSSTASRLRQAGGIYSSLVKGARDNSRMRSPAGLFTEHNSSQRKVPSRSSSAYRSSKFIQKSKLNSSFTSGLHHTFAENQAKAIPEEESKDLSSLYPSPPYESGFPSFSELGSANDVEFAIQELLTSLREDYNISLKIQRVDDYHYLVGEERKKIQLKISGNTLYSQCVQYLVRLGGGYIDFLEYLSKNDFFQ